MVDAYRVLAGLFIVYSLGGPARGSEFVASIQTVRELLTNITANVHLSIVVEQPNCVHMQCKVVCFNGKIGEIEKDILELSLEELCPELNELWIYNYQFPNDTIEQGFLGKYGARIQKLYIATSNVTGVEGGAFGNGIFEKLSFENLRFEELHKDFFKDISGDFYSLSIYQTEHTIRYISEDFLDYVKYQIQSLSLWNGIGSVRNLTAAENLLNNLVFVDVSFNDFGSGLTSSTFNKLSVVEYLFLSHSNISYLPEYIFSDMVSTLKALDLSYNQLHTVSRTIFGWREIPSDLFIDMDGNPWECSCELSQQMQEIFKYSSKKMFCESPELYHNWSVFDDRLCQDASEEGSVVIVVPTTTTRRSTSIGSTASRPCKPCYEAESVETTAATSFEDVATEHISGGTTIENATNEVQLQCQALPDLRNIFTQIVNSPTLKFAVRAHEVLQVDVHIQSEGLNESYGLMWFSKVTKQFYKMEVNYNDYGLGCYCSVSNVTSVTDLLPDVAYTFCLVLKNQLTISPFSCKSIHVGGNLDVEYGAWLTRDMQATGISLVVFGIVMFSFVGILLVFLALKQKPTLLKGSKRVAPSKDNRNEIVVFPKDKTVDDFRQKEQMLSKRCSRSTISCHRRPSTDSVDSNQSYMNANLYEVIPAYQKFSDASSQNQPPEDLEETDRYLQPLTTASISANLVRYAEIPSRAKRISSDPLPEVPVDQAPLSLALSVRPDRAEDQSVEYITTLDSQV